MHHVGSYFVVCDFGGAISDDNVLYNLMDFVIFQVDQPTVT